MLPLPKGSRRDAAPARRGLRRHACTATAVRPATGITHRSQDVATRRSSSRPCPGQRRHGIEFVAEARERGAVAVLSDREPGAGGAVAGAVSAAASAALAAWALAGAPRAPPAHGRRHRHQRQEHRRRPDRPHRARRPASVSGVFGTLAYALPAPQRARGADDAGGAPTWRRCSPSSSSDGGTVAVDGGVVARDRDRSRRRACRSTSSCGPTSPATTSTSTRHRGVLRGQAALVASPARRPAGPAGDRRRRPDDGAACSTSRAPATSRSGSATAAPSPPASRGSRVEWHVVRPRHAGRGDRRRTAAGRAPQPAQRARRRRLRRGPGAGRSTPSPRACDGGRAGSRPPGARGDAVAGLRGVRRLRAHPGRPRAGARRAARASPTAAHRGVRLRRRPRPAASGRRWARSSGRLADVPIVTSRQPAQRGSRRRSSTRSWSACGPAGNPRALTIPDRREAIAAALAVADDRSIVAGRRQGPRDRADLRRPDGAVRRPRGGARAGAPPEARLMRRTLAELAAPPAARVAGDAATVVDRRRHRLAGRAGRATCSSPCPGSGSTGTSSSPMPPAPAPPPRSSARPVGVPARRSSWLPTRSPPCSASPPASGRRSAWPPRRRHRLDRQDDHQGVPRRAARDHVPDRLPPRASRNSQAGFPAELCNQPDDLEWMVAELGMSHAGELDRLGAVAQPGRPASTP